MKGIPMDLAGRNDNYGFVALAAGGRLILDLFNPSLECFPCPGTLPMRVIAEMLGVPAAD
jgi:hypothetical protein